MSSALVWGLINKNNSFKRTYKKQGVHFSAEPGNLANKHSFKYSTLANKAVIGIEATKGGAQLTLKTAAAKKSPAKGLYKANLTKGVRTNAKTIKALTNQYRPDLTAAALGRYTVLRKAAVAAKKN